MKPIYLFLIAVLTFPSICFQRSIIKGTIRYNNENGNPIPGVEIKCGDDCNRQISDSRGVFFLEFPYKDFGDDVQLSFSESNLAVVNHHLLDITIPRNRELDLQIYMSEPEERDRHAARYYRISIEKAIQNNFETQKDIIAGMQIDVQNKKRKIAELQEKYNRALSIIKELSIHIAQTDFTRASTLYNRAFKAFIDGDLNQAIQILDDNKIRKNLENARLLKEQADSAIKQCADSYLLKAQTYVVQFKFTLANEYFKRAISANPGDWEKKFHYSVFLKSRNKPQPALKVCEEIVPSVENCIHKATILNNLGILYSDINQLAKAKDSYLQALEIFQSLTDDIQETCKPLIAGIHNNLGTLHLRTKQFPEAKTYLFRSLELRSTLVGKDPDTYFPEVAETTYSLGQLFGAVNKYTMAEHYYEESLRTFKLFNKRKSGIHSSAIAMVLSGMGDFYRKNEKIKETLSCYREASQIYQDLSLNDPDIYKPKLALILRKLGSTYSATKEFSTANSCYSRSLKIYNELSENEPDKYLPEVSLLINYKGLAYLSQGKREMAWNSFERAYLMRVKGNKLSPNYEIDLAQSLLSYALYYLDEVERNISKKNCSIARQKCNEARELLKKHPQNLEAIDLLKVIDKIAQSLKRQCN